GWRSIISSTVRPAGPWRIRSRSEPGQSRRNALLKPRRVHDDLRPSGNQRARTVGEASVSGANGMNHTTTRHGVGRSASLSGMRIARATVALVLATFVLGGAQVAGAASVPGAPTITRVSTGVGRVALYLGAPPDNGSAITGYQATCESGSSMITRTSAWTLS